MPQPPPLPGLPSLILHLVSPFCFFGLKIAISGTASLTSVHLCVLIVQLQLHDGDTQLCNGHSVSGLSVSSALTGICLVPPTHTELIPMQKELEAIRKGK